MLTSIVTIHLPSKQRSFLPFVNNLFIFYITELSDVIKLNLVSLSLLEFFCFQKNLKFKDYLVGHD